MAENHQDYHLIREDELLTDPLNDRKVSEVPLPPRKSLSIERLYAQENGSRIQAPNTDLVKAYLMAQGQLSKEAFLSIVRQATERMSREANLLRIEGRVVMFGDIHGQFYDLCEILRKMKFGETSNKFLFLGDYVDRGMFGPEVVALLFSLKIKFPNQVYMLRGNHETRECTEDFNFRDQMLARFDEEAYDAVIDAFQALPLAAVVNGEHVALHGGISSQITSLQQINEIERVAEPGSDECLFNDLLWADPLPSRQALRYDQIENEDRLISVKFGYSILQKLLKQSGMKTLIRAHQQKDAGYKLHRWAGPDEDPPCITIFSAPNYCGHENPASILVTGNDYEKNKVLVYEETYSNLYFLVDPETGDYPADPYDGISWFMPAMKEWLTEIFQTILDKINEQEDESSTPLIKDQQAIHSAESSGGVGGGQTLADLVGQYESQYGIQHQDSLTTGQGAMLGATPKSPIALKASMSTVSQLQRRLSLTTGSQSITDQLPKEIQEKLLKANSVVPKDQSQVKRDLEQIKNAQRKYLRQRDAQMEMRRRASAQQKKQ